MFANMQRITVALLVVAFVPATVPVVYMSGPSYDCVLDFYSGIDHKLIGTFIFRQWRSINNVVSVRVDKPFNFSSEYHNVYANVYGYKSVKPGCAPVEDAMVDSDDENTYIYNGGALELSRSAGFEFRLIASLIPDGSQSIPGRVVVMYAQKQENDEHLAIACGRIRYAHSTDYFLEELNGMPTLPPVPGKTNTTTVPVSKDVEAILPGFLTNPKLLTLPLAAFTPLVPVKDIAKEAFIFYDTNAGNVVLVGLVAPMVASWNEGTAVAVLYRSENVTPKCVTTGAAVGVHDANRNRTRPAILFKSRFETHLEAYYEINVSCELVSPKSDCDIMGRVVVLYTLQSDSPTVLDDFLQPTNPHTPIACGPIRPRHPSGNMLLPKD